MEDKGRKKKLPSSENRNLFDFGFKKAKLDNNVKPKLDKTDETDCLQSAPTACEDKHTSPQSEKQQSSSTSRPVTACENEHTSESEQQPSSSASKPLPSSSSKPFTDEECVSVVKQLFEDKKVHNRYLCAEKFCSDISSSEKQRLLPKKFGHAKLSSYWWLCFVEGKGMYCMICKKLNVKHNLNKRDVFVNTPSTRYLEDSLKCHASSAVHRSAIEMELVQKVSLFHKEVCKKDKVEVSLYEKVFSTAYFIMKNFISNRKLLPLLDLVENVFEYGDLKYFNHKSAGSLQEIFLSLGETVKDVVVQQAKKADSFGLLTDEVSDISVTEYLITFIQYVDTDAGKVRTSLLSCQDVLDKFSSANSEAIAALLLESMESSDLSINKLTGFASDGASVMMGKKAGVAALLRKVSPSLINIHCVCHKLALSCTDSNESLKYIKDIEILLRQLWNFFENSPKRMAVFLKIQLELNKLNLSTTASTKVAKRLKKACRTRWLSLDASVKAVYSEFEAILQTLAQFENSDATALGLLKKMKNIKFLGAIYILKEVLPILSALSRTFQRDSLSFSSITPQVNMTKDRLDQLLQDETPLTQLQSDIDSFTNISTELSLSKKHMDEIQSLFSKYITALKSNIDRRFGDSSQVVSAFCIFDPLTVPEQEKDGLNRFKEYGINEIKILGSHFYNEEEGSADAKEQLLVEWRGLKYHLKDVIKPKVPQAMKEGSGKVTSTEWCLMQLLSVPAYKEFFPRMTKIAEVAASLPVTNAWPERGASALKNVKTRHRNRIKSEMLEAILHVTVNGPESKSQNAEEVIKLAVGKWLKEKNRKKLAKKIPKPSSGITAPRSLEASSQTDPVIMCDQEEVRIAVKKLAMEALYNDDSEECCDSDYSESDLCC